MKKIIPFSIGLFALFCFATSAHAAIVFDTATSTNVQFGVTSVTSQNLTVGSGSNRAAALEIWFGSSTAVTNFSLTFAGKVATLVAGTDTTTSTGQRTMIYQVINPNSGVQHASATWTGTEDIDIGIITVSGADQTTPLNNGNTTSSAASAATRSLTITSNSGDLTTTIGATGDTWTGNGTNKTLRWGIDQTVIGGDTGPGTGTTTHTWTDPFGGQMINISGANFKTAPNTAPSVKVRGGGIPNATRKTFVKVRGGGGVGKVKFR